MKTSAVRAGSTAATSFGGEPGAKVVGCGVLAGAAARLPFAMPGTGPEAALVLATCAGMSRSAAQWDSAAECYDGGWEGAISRRAQRPDARAGRTTGA